jgi:hypothetical protein
MIKINNKMEQVCVVTALISVAFVIFCAKSHSSSPNSSAHDPILKIIEKKKKYIENLVLLAECIQ